jgi:hypothetical protein
MLRQLDLKRILWNADNQFHLVNDLHNLFYIQGLLRALLAFKLIIKVLRHDCALLATFFQKFEVIFSTL